jgi:hypothetical protein
VADYGVNIKVAVQNSQKVKQLGDELNRTGRFVDTSNKLLAKMAGVTVDAVANVGNLNKALAEAKKNFNDAVFGTKAFNDAARELVKTNDLVTSRSFTGYCGGRALNGRSNDVRAADWACSSINNR